MNRTVPILATCLLAAALLAQGCFDPDLDGPGGYRCAGNNDCPPGQTCHLQSKTCKANGAGLDLGGKEAAAPDQMARLDKGIGPKEDKGSSKPDLQSKLDKKPPPPKCGNGAKEVGEECDFKDLDSQSCISKGYTGGDLSCFSCKFIYTHCYKATKATSALATLSKNSAVTLRAAWNSPANGGMVAWSAPFNPSITTKNVRIQAVDSGLKPQLYLPGGQNLAANTKVVSTQPAVANLGLTQLVVWADNRSNIKNIYGVRVSLKGTVTPVDQGGILISQGNNAQSMPAVACHNSSTCLVVWADGSLNQTQIKGQLIVVKSGSLSQAANSVTISTGGSKWHDQPSVATDGGGYLVTWVSHIASNTSMVHGRGLTNNSAFRSTTSRVIADPGSSRTVGSPAVAHPWGYKHFVVVWHDTRNIGRDIYGARVDNDAAAVSSSDAKGIRLAASMGHSMYPSVACVKTGCLVAFSEGKTSLGQSALKAVRLTHAGLLLLKRDKTGLQLTTAIAIGSPAVTLNNANTYTVFYRENLTSSPFIRALTFTP